MKLLHDRVESDSFILVAIKFLSGLYYRFEYILVKLLAMTAYLGQQGDSEVTCSKDSDRALLLCQLADRKGPSEGFRRRGSHNPVFVPGSPSKSFHHQPHPDLKMQGHSDYESYQQAVIEYLQCKMNCCYPYDEPDPEDPNQQSNFFRAGLVWFSRPENSVSRVREDASTGDSFSQSELGLLCVISVIRSWKLHRGLD